MADLAERVLDLVDVGLQNDDDDALPGHIPASRIAHPYTEDWARQLAADDVALYGEAAP
jgi:hypothetical protein